MLKIKLLGVILLITCILTGCYPQSSNFTTSLNEIVKPYRFSLIKWELNALSYEIEDFILDNDKYTANDSPVVIEYFAFTNTIRGLEYHISLVKDGIETGDLISLQNQLEELKGQRDSIKKDVEKIIEQQIRETLIQLNISSSLGDSNISINFPPVNFSLEFPPHLLVVSPRDKIERIKEVILIQDLTLVEIDDIESAVTELGYSATVLEIGGMATFPSFVTDNAGLQFTINAAVEEWLHQYLFFKPLGFLYGLQLIGLPVDSDIPTINETVVGIASNEVGAMIYQKYYESYFNTQNNEAEVETAAEAENEEEKFDYYAEMRQIRIAVDNYLASGKVEEAEAFMEEKRLYILDNGYYIRKLNQAYFAFYGTYASYPSSTNPIGDELRELREQSSTIQEFLDRVSSITNRDDLLNALN
ncbi:MAG: hypothetical protein PHE15_01985 [Dehalococcoidales bacterium]|nr:hypothetical protein [Dehalococcoidales bacterium]